MASSPTSTHVGSTLDATPKAISPGRRAPRESAATPDTGTSTGWPASSAARRVGIASGSTTTTRARPSAARRDTGEETARRDTGEETARRDTGEETARRGYTGEKASAADSHDDGVNGRFVFEDLFGEGAGARGDLQLVVGVAEERSGVVRMGDRRLVRLRVLGAHLPDVGAVLPDLLDFDFGSRFRDEHGGGHPEDTGGVGVRQPGVTARRDDDADRRIELTALASRELTVEGTPCLEHAGVLQELALQPRFGRGRGREQRGTAQVASRAGTGGENIDAADHLLLPRRRAGVTRRDGRGDATEAAGVGRPRCRWAATRRCRRTPRPRCTAGTIPARAGRRWCEPPHDPARRRAGRADGASTCASLLASM